MESSKPRNHAFDLLCGLCILRMVSLHVMTFCGHAHDAWWEGVMDWTYYFMSFFFFKAGYFNKGVGGPTGPYLKAKTLRLLVPYLAAGLIGDIIYFAFLPPLTARYHHPVEPLSWAKVWEQSHFYGNPPTWFLFSFFMTYVAVHFIERKHYLHWLVLLFPAVSWWLWAHDVALWMSLSNLFMGIYCFYLGHFWHWLSGRLGLRRTLMLSLLLVGGFMLGNVWFPGTYVMSSNTFTGHPLWTVVDTTAILCGLSGVLVSLRVPRLPVISFIGQHSMVYFISHYPILYIYKFTHLCFGRSIYGRYDEAILLVPTVFIICTWLVPYVERIPWLSGRWDKTTTERLCNKTTTI